MMPSINWKRATLIAAVTWIVTGFMSGLLDTPDRGALYAMLAFAGSILLEPESHEETIE